MISTASYDGCRRKSKSGVFARNVRLGVKGLFAMCVSVTCAFAQEATYQGQSKPVALNIEVGDSKSVDLPRDASQVFIANPKVATAVVRSLRKLFIVGIINGKTSMYAMDKQGHTILALDVNVSRDLAPLRQLMKNNIPNSEIDCSSVGNTLILSGSVINAGDARLAVDLATAFMNQNGANASIVNNVIVRQRDQVQLSVVVSEVSREVLKQFGINLSGSWKSFNFTNDTPFAYFGANFPSDNRITGNFNFGGGSLKTMLSAFNRAGVARVLAEPNLTALSGETAKFTVGGEIPVPSNLSCTSTTNAVQSCVPSIGYKTYGVSLSFTPLVFSENHIVIRVATDVTEVDNQRAMTINFSGTNTAVPGFTTRRSETSVEVPSGGAMYIAGLIQKREKASVDGLPGLFNLPILGALFRSTEYQHEETELVIIVVPHIVKPVSPSDLSTPNDRYRPTNDAKRILLGQLNERYGQNEEEQSHAVGFETD